MYAATVPVCITLLFAVVLTCNGIQAQNITTAQAKDLRAFLSDRSLVTRQINCVLGKTQCDRLGGQLKKAIPEVLHRNCARCTSVQASNARKLINFIQNHYPVAYREVLNKYRKKIVPATRLQPTKKPGKPTKILDPQPTSNVPSFQQQTKISSAQSPPSGVIIETASRQTRISSPQSPPKNVTIDTARRQTKISSGQTPPNIVTIEIDARPTKISSSQSPQRNVTIETATSQTKISTPKPT